MAFYTRLEPRVEPLVMIKEDPPDASSYASQQVNSGAHCTGAGYDYEAGAGPALPPNGLEAFRESINGSRSDFPPRALFLFSWQTVPIPPLF